VARLEANQRKDNNGVEKKTEFIFYFTEVADL